MFIGCAQQLRPTGGPEDTTPPKLDLTKSTKNEYTNFAEKEVKLVFDEFIDLKNVSKQVIISPPFKKNPKIEARGKEVYIKFDKDEPLKENATYVVNFGDAIQDFTEGNIFKNLRYIFSTGDKIDSLELSGKVVDSYNGEAVENCLVMLYETFEDSIVYKERPLYFASTDKDGLFNIQNLRSDTFKLFVLKDENVNYLYDLDSEAIGYLDSLIVVSPTDTTYLELGVFVENQVLKRNSLSADEYGFVGLEYSIPPDSVQVNYNLEEYGEYILERKDNLLNLWYNFPKDTSFQIFLTDNREYIDTLKIRKRSKSKWKEEAELEVLKNNLVKSKLDPDESLILSFNQPLDSVFQDSLYLINAQYDSLIFVGNLDTTNRRDLLINYQWQEDSSYTLSFLPKSIKDIYGLNPDTTDIDFSIQRRDHYSQLLWKYENFETGFNYQVKLKNGDKIIDQRTINKTREGEFLFEKLEPGSYMIEILEDKNANGRWDSGSYRLKQKSEEIWVFEVEEELKSNWTVEVLQSGLEEPEVDFDESEAIDSLAIDSLKLDPKLKEGN